MVSASTISVESLHFDRGNWTVSPGATLNLNVGDYDSDAGLNGFDGTLTRLVLTVVSSFDLWIDSFGITDPAQRAKAANPDGDSLNNLGELALDGDPTSGADDGKVTGKITPVGGVEAFTLTLPVRNGTVPDPADPASGELRSGASDTNEKVALTSLALPHRRFTKPLAHRALVRRMHIRAVPAEVGGPDQGHTRQARRRARLHFPEPRPVAAQRVIAADSRQLNHEKWQIQLSKPRPPAFHQIPDQALIPGIVGDFRVGLALIPQHTGQRKPAPPAHAGLKEESGPERVIARPATQIEPRPAARPRTDALRVGPRCS